MVHIEGSFLQITCLLHTFRSFYCSTYSMNQYAIKMHVEWRFIQLSKILPASASAVMCQLAAFLITAACNAMHGIQNDAAFWNIHTFHAYTSKCNRRDWCGAGFCQLLYKCSCLWLFSSIDLCIFASFNPCQGNGPMQLRSKKLKHFPKTQLKLPTFGWVLWIWYGLVVPIEIYALACLLCVPYDSWVGFNKVKGRWIMVSNNCTYITPATDSLSTITLLHAYYCDRICVQSSK